MKHDTAANKTLPVALNQTLSQLQKEKNPQLNLCLELLESVCLIKKLWSKEMFKSIK